MTTGPDPHEQFALLSRQLRAGTSREDVYDVVVSHAVSLIDGCDHAGIGVLDGDRFASVASTDAVMELVDGLQNDLREGPCLEASVEARIQVDDDITKASTWPRLAEQVVARTPVRAMLAVPLIHESERNGALNVFADSPGAFTQASIGQAAILASMASVALAGAHNADLARQYEEGMATNREIGTAVGILMATHGVSQEQAFSLLAAASQRMNRKLRDVAAGVVRGDARAG